MHYYSFNIGDYQSHTSHLTDLEDLAYRRMLDWYYLHENPLPSDIQEIARQIRMRTHSDCIASVLSEFFEKTDSGWVHHRANKELSKALEKSQKASQSAKIKWQKQKDANAMRTHSEGNATQYTIHNTQDTLHNTQNTNKNISSDYAAWFDCFWQKYPKKVGKEPSRKAFIKAVKSQDIFDEIMIALDWQIKSQQWLKNSGEFIPHASTYLNQARWQDEKPKLTSGSFDEKDYGETGLL